MLIGNSLYGIIRDYYFQKGEQTFLNSFGRLFELYFEDLTSRYLASDQYIKLPENIKGADYKLEFDNVIFIIEMKSALLSIKGKQQNPNLNTIDDFFSRNITKAYEQLKSSCNRIEGKKPVIKLILLYENFRNIRMIENSLPEIFNNDKNCWIITIAELEILLVTFNTDRIKFDEVLMKMLESSADRETLLNIIDKLKLSRNLPFVGEYDYFNKNLKRLASELGTEYKPI
ncbi:hypothetical protein IZU99_04635 [Oscillospiraceae bacterium CM]|nr:hypothetical protein IZU99_04635 [Oscillospiraceae bacterium CM]